MTNSVLFNLGLKCERLATGPLLAIFDRDGTLVPIADNPAQAVIPAQARDLLTSLSVMKNVVAGVLSARSLRQLKSDFGGAGLVLAGNYGLEIDFPGLPPFRHPVAQRSRRQLAEAKTSLTQNLKPQMQVVLEDHGLSLCLHWHRTPADMLADVHAAIAGLAGDFPDLRVRTLPTSYEILPALEWDKSSSLDQIEKTFKRNDWIYLFVGDSESDEPAFRWVNAHNGISFRVGDKTESRATFRLKSPAQVIELIKELVALRAH